MNGAVVDVTGGDGLSIINSAHTLKQSTTTWSNVVTGNPEFDAAGSALKTALSVGQLNAYNHFGQNIPMEYDTIVTSDDYTVVQNVSTLMRSTSWINPAVASNTSGQNAGVINFWQGQFKHVIWPRLSMDANGNRNSTRAKAWFIIDSNKFDGHLAYQERPTLIGADSTVDSTSGAGFDIDTYDWTFGSRSMYNFAIVSGRAILGSFPA